MLLVGMITAGLLCAAGGVVMTFVAVTTVLHVLVLLQFSLALCAHRISSSHLLPINCCDQMTIAGVKSKV